MNLSLNQTVLTSLLCVRQAWTRNLPLTQKDYTAHMHGFAVYVKEGLPFVRDLSLENSVIVLLVFHISITFFVLPSSSNIDEVLSISPCANVVVFGDFNVDHKDWLTYSGGTDRPGQLCYNFSQMTLLRWLTFLLGSHTVILTVQLFFISFFLLTLILQLLYLHCEILNRMPHFIA